MAFFARHGDDEHGHGHGHGHGNEDSERQHALASLYWYTIAAVLIIAFIARLVAVVIARQRSKRIESRSGFDSSVSTVERLFEGSRAAVSGSFLSRRRPSWLASLPLKRAFLVIMYAAFVSFLLTWKAVKHDGNFLERLGFRAAWITATQTSLPFLLAARTNPIGLILGTSYERINWFHRWVSRVFVASATIHGSFFIVEWVAADFFWTELRTVGMVKWGLAAWAVLVWTLISTLPPFRRMRYEFFVLQHIISVALLLVLLLIHVPDHHHFSIWCAVVAFLYDIVTRSANPIWRNIRLGFSSRILTRYAHKAHVDAVDDELTVVTVRNVGFNWTPGQHVLIWSPTFPRQFPHPFTISSIPSSETSSRDLQLVLKTKDGFTRALNGWGRKADHTGGEGVLRVLLAGPYGALPNWRQYDNVVLIATSTGASFTTPILEDLITTQSSGRVQKLSALYIARRKAHVEPYLNGLSKVVSRAKEMGISVRIEVAVTQSTRNIADLDESPANQSRERLLEAEPGLEGRGDSVELERFSLDSNESQGSKREDQLLKEEVELGLDDGYAYDASSITETEGRPDVAAFLRTAVGNVPGHVAVAVCGGSPVEKTVQRTVASLRSERVDGLGAYGIFLHIERSDI
ncbi:ferric-chelate reductase Frp1 [Neonectria magnoliae]|uniref:ferric-chelate reductase (NADPH) n=1 Tax=Neonectria magnoliae TaxID=2732573 RepID=A0ABR1HTJ7_9HYPO